MNVAVIFAGGTGQRMNSRTKPKQFLELHGKPILIYTIELFQQNEQIDAIVISCLAEWIDYCEKLIKKYDLSKVKAVVPGGKSGQESIYNGLVKAKEISDNGSIVLIHDGVRPLIDDTTINNAINCVKEKGSAVTVSPAIETIFIKGEDGGIDQIMERSKCQLARAPQCFYLNDILNAHEKARTDGIDTFIDSASMMRYYGHKLYTVEGPSENIKITTPSDFYIFRALTDTRENYQIFGF